MKESKEVHMQGLVITELTTCENVDDYTRVGYANASTFPACVHNTFI